jgi:hypothetical protein
MDPPQKRVIKTAAGHVVIFNDKSGAEGIEIKDGVNGHDVILDKKGIEVTDGVSKHNVKLDKNGITIEDAVNKHKVTLAGSGVSIEAQGGAKIQLASSGITIDAGSGDVQISGGTIKLGQGAQAGIMRALPAPDQAVGNLGAPVVLTGPGTTTVLVPMS